MFNLKLWLPRFEGHGADINSCKCRAFQHGIATGVSVILQRFSMHFVEPISWLPPPRNETDLNGASNIYVSTPQKGTQKMAQVDRFLKLHSIPQTSSYKLFFPSMTHLFSTKNQTKNRFNYFTSSDPHHDMLSGGCQVRVVIKNMMGRMENLRTLISGFLGLVILVRWALVTMFLS